MTSKVTSILTLGVVAFLSASSAYAACTGTNGRGWASGNGNGQFAMTTRDKSCKINFPGFIDDARKTRTPATDVTITREPKNGKISIVAGKGLIYTPAQGFKGKDKFCTRNKSSKIRGKTLSGCITVAVQ
ncbi:MAG: hypothetical protein QHC90_13795 [Shinella sp.]|jgi:hypothetical protein|nr:hypothetical protein [Shinella sp.]